MTDPYENDPEVKRLSMKERMMGGWLYQVDGPLAEEQQAAKRWIAEYNAALAKTPNERRELLKVGLGSVGEKSIVRAPFFVDYGTNIHLGKGRKENVPLLPIL